MLLFAVVCVVFKVVSCVWLFDVRCCLLLCVVVSCCLCCVWLFGVCCCSLFVVLLCVDDYCLLSFGCCWYVLVVRCLCGACCCVLVFGVVCGELLFLLSVESLFLLFGVAYCVVFVVCCVLLSGC